MQQLVSVNKPPTTKNYTLSLHDALPISAVAVLSTAALLALVAGGGAAADPTLVRVKLFGGLDRKSTRLNSSHPSISYAVFCLKKKTIHNLYLLHTLLSDLLITQTLLSSI